MFEHTTSITEISSAEVKRTVGSTEKCKQLQLSQFRVRFPVGLLSIIYQTYKFGKINSISL